MTLTPILMCCIRYIIFYVVNIYYKALTIILSIYATGGNFILFDIHATGGTSRKLHAKFCDVKHFFVKE